MTEKLKTDNQFEVPPSSRSPDSGSLPHQHSSTCRTTVVPSLSSISGLESRPSGPNILPWVSQLFLRLDRWDARIGKLVKKKWRRFRNRNRWFRLEAQLRIRSDLARYKNLECLAEPTKSEMRERICNHLVDYREFLLTMRLLPIALTLALIVAVFAAALLLPPEQGTSASPPAVHSAAFVLSYSCAILAYLRHSYPVALGRHLLRLSAAAGSSFLVGRHLNADVALSLLLIWTFAELLTLLMPGAYFAIHYALTRAWCIRHSQSVIVSNLVQVLVALERDDRRGFSSHALRDSAVQLLEQIAVTFRWVARKRLSDATTNMAFREKNDGVANWIREVKISLCAPFNGTATHVSELAECLVSVCNGNWGGLKTSAPKTGLSRLSHFARQAIRVEPVGLGTLLAVLGFFVALVAALTRGLPIDNALDFLIKIVK